MSESELPRDLGTLDWQPALTAGHLLADPVANALREGSIDAGRVFVTEIDPDLADTTSFCRAYDTPLENSANCVVVAGRRGDVTLSAAILVLATDRADVNRTVRKQLGLRKISFASMDDAVADTGMTYGGIGPAGLPAGWRLLVDTAVTERGWVIIGSGLRSSKLAIPGALAGRLPGADVLDLTLG